MTDIVPLITFKAGRCDGETNNLPAKIRCDPERGYIYLYAEEDFGHFCWRPRSNDVSHPDNFDLIMPPGDARFVPYTGRDNPITDDATVTSPINGRIFTLKFSSSSQRYFFWLQSPPQYPNRPNQFSSRDLKIGELVDAFLQGATIDEESIREASIAPAGNDDDEDEEGGGGGGSRLFRAESTGGAGPDATGGDIREEGEEAREGGADGARATTNEASTLVQNLINSLQQQGSGSSARQVQQADIYTTLPNLLSSTTTIPLLSTFPENLIDSLLSSLPAPILLLAHHTSDDFENDENEEEVTLNSNLASDEKFGLIMSLSLDQKRQVLAKVLRSPQLHQSLGSLTVALRDGGLPMVSSALGIPVQNEGFVRGSAMPLGGGEAIRAFMDGVREQVKEEKDGEDDEMDVE